MKRGKLLLLALLLTSMVSRAGGLMTNTNYHIAFDRMFARGASMEIDAAYSNPAGLAWATDGWQMSLNLQKPWQRRDIETDIDGFLANPTLGYAGYDLHHKYKGVASAPVVPALFAVYKHDRWALSSMIGIVGSGGFVKYDEGIPMFNVMAMGKIFEQSLGAIRPEMLQIGSEVKGKQYIYGGQLNFSYRLLDCLSAAVGLRANYYDGYNRGFVTAAAAGQQLMDLRLDVTQRAWGFAPIVSVDFHKGPLTVAARYEFRTKLNTKNDTEALNITMQGQTTDIRATALNVGNEATLAAVSAQMGAGMAEKLSNYMPNAHVRYDMPSLLSVAVGYDLTPRLRAAAEYHFFDDKSAHMAGDRQKELTHGTHEFLLGAEYDVNDRLTLSCGGQRTDYGLSDAYQQNTSFACDSYSVGLGGAYRLNDRMRLNFSYFCTLYGDYKVESASYLGTPYPGSDTYSRTNHVIGIGLDYKF